VGISQYSLCVPCIFDISPGVRIGQTVHTGALRSANNHNLRQICSSVHYYGKVCVTSACNVATNHRSNRSPGDASSGNSEIWQCWISYVTQKNKQRM